MTWAIIWKFKYWIAIAVLFIFGLGQTAYINHLSGKLDRKTNIKMPNNSNISFITWKLHKYY